MWQLPYRKVDLEAGATPLYPTMLERPELRWSFIRKVYSILTFQLLLTVAVSAVVVKVRPVALFFATTPDGLALYILLLCTPFILLYPLSYYHHKHPVNYILLGLFTVCISFAIGLTSAFTDGKPFFLVLHLLRMGNRINLVTLKFECLLSLCHDNASSRWHCLSSNCSNAVISLDHREGNSRSSDPNSRGGRWSHFVHVLGRQESLRLQFSRALLVCCHFRGYSLLPPSGIYDPAIVFCGYIIYDTDNLIKRYSYDEYIWASVALYLDIINLFLSLLAIFRAADH
ncbi:hypothetical protein C3L33_04127, partial [Rhododendron williamsianum]